jgi:transposase
MEQITTVGIDLAKKVFSLHGVDAAGRTVLRRTVRRERLVETVASLSPCLIGMEACCGAHEWGRRFEQYGHRVKLMAPRFVAPYRKSGKDDGKRCRSGVRGGEPAEHALCAGKERRAAGAARSAPGALRVRR